MTPFDSADCKRVLDYRQTVVVVRSRSRAGYAVTLSASNADSSTALSSHVSAVWHYQREKREHFCAQLYAYLRKARPDVVIVVGESQLLWALRSCWVALISHHLTWDFRDSLPTLYVFWRKRFTCAGQPHECQRRALLK